MHAHPLFRPLAAATAVVVLGLLVALAFAPGAYATLEGLSLALAQRAENAPASQRVTWIASEGPGTDAGALRSQVARAIEAAAAAGARAIVVAIPLNEPSDSADLARVRSFLEGAESSPDVAMRARLQAWVTELDHDGDLERAIRAAGNVVLLGSPGVPLLERFTAAARAIGVEPALPPEADGVTRRDRLYLQDPSGTPLPSLAFTGWLAAHTPPHASLPTTERGALAGSIRSLHVAAGGGWVPHYGRRAGVDGGTPRLALKEPLTGRSARALAGQIVVIGGTQTTLAVPTGPGLSLGEATTQRIASLEAGDYAVVPRVARIYTVLALLLAIGWAAILAPRLRTSVGFTAAILLGIALFLIEVLLVSIAHIWVPLIPAALSLPLATLAVWLLPDRTEPRRARPEPVVPLPAMGPRPASRPPAPRPEAPRRAPAPAADPFYSDLPPLPPTRPGSTPRSTAAAHTEAAAAPLTSLRQISAALEARREEPTRAEVADLLLGRSKRPPKPKLGRYELEREIGKGAMGTVYYGRDPTINRIVAVKAIPIVEEFNEADLADARGRFFREAEMAGRLKHPSIVTVYDAGEDNGIAWIAMEYVQGRMLSEFTVSDRLLPPSQVLEICARIADALDYAHSQEVIHRDIKPANVLITPETLETKITDFGIARLTNASATRSGIVLGTPSFMAPERLEGRNVTGRSDLFALGVTLFQLLAGQLPFRADSMEGLMYKITHLPHPPLKTIRPDLPPCTSSIVDRALQKNPADRFATAGEMARFLRACARACNT
ncbi:MAG: protein kinase [Pseudomonadota bacterium]